MTTRPTKDERDALVDGFAEVMKQKLDENSAKPSWRLEILDDLFYALGEEVKELREATWQLQAEEDDAKTAVRRREVVREAADVANFVMMIADVFDAVEPSDGPRYAERVKRLERRAALATMALSGDFDGSKT